jgi:hypothetical protein
MLKNVCIRVYTREIKTDTQTHRQTDRETDTEIEREMHLPRPQVNAEPRLCVIDTHGLKIYGEVPEVFVKTLGGGRGVMAFKKNWQGGGPLVWVSFAFLFSIFLNLNRGFLSLHPLPPLMPLCSSMMFVCMRENENERKRKRERKRERDKR